MNSRSFRTPWGKDVIGYYREDTSDENTHISCLVEDEYRINRLNSFGTAIDLGGHIGAVTLALQSKGLKTITVEPLKENQEMIEKNMEANGFKDFILHKGAVSTTGAFEKKIYKNETMGHGFIGSSLPISESFVTVPTVSLNAIIASIPKDERCHFLKIDIEGGEWDILEDTSRFYLDRVDNIAIEIHSKSGEIVGRKDVLALLKNLFVDVSEDYFPLWCADGTLVHGYFKHK